LAPETATVRPWPDAYPVLLPLLPLVHFAWADGVLSSEELRAFRDQVEDQPWIPGPARKALAPWLDPDDPPEPTELCELETRIREAVDPDQEELPGSLAELGLRLGRRKTGKDLWADAIPRAAAKYYASPILAGDRLYCAREDGVLSVVQVGRSGMKVLAQNDMGERLAAAPVPVGGKLLVRGVGHLFCIGQ